MQSSSSAVLDLHTVFNEYFKGDSVSWFRFLRRDMIWWVKFAENALISDGSNEINLITFMILIIATQTRLSTDDSC